MVFRWDRVVMFGLFVLLIYVLRADLPGIQVAIESVDHISRVDSDPSDRWAGVIVFLFACVLVASIAKMAVSERRSGQ